MTTSALSDKERVQFDHFFDYLESEGFPTGPGERVRAFVLAGRAGKSYRDRRLKTLLCPVFARSADEQQRFYTAYDFFFRPDELPSAPPVPAGQKVLTPVQGAPPFNRKKWIRLGAAALALSVALAAFAYFDLLGKLRYWAGLTTHLSSMNVTPPPAPKAPDVQTRRTTKPVPEQDQRSCRGWECVTQGPRPWIIDSPLLAYLLLLIVARTAHWHRYQTIRRERSRVPPFSWPVVTLPPAGFAFDARLRFLAQSLRRRISGDIRLVDVPGTLAATIQSGGFPAVRYRQSAKIPEYLFLVEQRSAQDHLAAWTLAICSALARAQVALDVFTYRGDPRRVSAYDLKQRPLPRRASPAGINLRRLLVRTRGNRVALFSSGSDLLHPYTGRLAGWARNLLEDHDCSLFVPGATFEWGETERTLSEFLTVAPLRVRTLELALISGESREALLGFLQHADSTDSAAVPADCLRPEAAKSGSGRPSLAMFLDDDVFQWLCACAVYPVLDWNLTLHLGALIDPSGGLFHEQKILQLVRISWLRAGAIPGEWRARLVDSARPELIRRVREFLVAEMRKNPAPAGSFAADMRAIQIAGQQYWCAPGSSTRAVLERALAQVPDVDIAQDYLLQRLVDGWKTSPAVEQVTETIRMAPRKLALDWRMLAGVALVVVLAFMITRQLWSVPYTRTVLMPVTETIPIEPVASANIDHPVKLEFSGNQHFSTQTLLRSVSGTNNPQVVADDIAGIYQNDGFKDVKVNWDYASTQGMLKFQIAEGARWTISDINWDDIRSRMSTNSAGVAQLSKILSSGKGQPFSYAAAQSDQQMVSRLVSPLVRDLSVVSDTNFDSANHTASIVLRAENAGKGVVLCTFDIQTNQAIEACKIPNPDQLDTSYRQLQSPVPSPPPGIELQITGNGTVGFGSLAGDQYTFQILCRPVGTRCSGTVQVLGHYKGNSRPVTPSNPSVDTVFEQEKDDELALADSAKTFFSAGDSARTIRFLTQAKAVQKTRVWQSSYPYLAAAYALTGDDRNFQVTLNDMLQTVQSGQGYLSFQFERESAVSALKTVRAAMAAGRRPESELDAIDRGVATIQDLIDRMPFVSAVNPASIPSGRPTTVTLTGRFPDDVKLSSLSVGIPQTWSATNLSITGTRLTATVNPGSESQGEIIILALYSRLGAATARLTVTARPAVLQTLRVHVRYENGSPAAGALVKVDDIDLSTPKVTLPGGDTEFSLAPGSHIVSAWESKGANAVRGQATITDKPADLTIVLPNPRSSATVPPVQQQQAPQKRPDGIANQAPGPVGKSAAVEGSKRPADVTITLPNSETVPPPPQNLRAQASASKTPATGNEPAGAVLSPNQGIVTGTIVDNKKQPVTDAVVTLTPTSGLVMSRGVPTDAQGRFSIVVDPGTYEMSASAPGLQSYFARAVVVNGKKPLTMNIQLKPDKIRSGSKQKK